MATAFPHVGDIGTDLRFKILDESYGAQAGAVVDVSSATTIQIKFRKPGGSVVTVTGALVTDGTDGLVKYTTTAATFLDEAGGWSAQVRVALGSGDWHTAHGKFFVESNLT